MTRTQLVRELAEACGTNNKAAKGMLDYLANVAIRETKKSGVFVLPGIRRLVRVNRKARLGRNAFGATRSLIAPTGRTSVPRDQIRAAVKK